jgi:hypothetical protein
MDADSPRSQSFKKNRTAATLAHHGPFSTELSELLV